MQKLKLLLLSFISLALLACANSGAYSTYSIINAKTKAKTKKRLSKLKQTGQTKSYVSYDDGYYKKGIAPSYTRDDAKQIVTDNVTKLQWQDNITAKDNKINWQAAIDYCSNLSLGGYSNWRLPNVTELLSIIDLGRSDPTMNPVFKHTNSNWYWSSTSIANKSLARNVYFLEGWNGASTKESSTRNVRCVRGEALIAPSFTRDHAQQVVIDNTNNLQWQDNAEVTDNRRKNWRSAIRYCEDLEHAGFTDWRLPNRNELYSIVDFSYSKTDINPAFRHTKSYEYWSSTSRASDSLFVYYINSNGDSNFYVKNITFDFAFGVRCVR